MGFTARVLIVSLLALLATAFTSMTVTAAEDQHLTFDADNPFQPSDDMMGDVDATIAAALMDDKLALIIMGANWCHDSQGLLDNFGDPNVAAVLGQKYRTLLIDVGHLDRGKEIISRFGMPVIYGTPTVLIIDPKTGNLINKDTMFQWFEAAKIGAAETLAYFDTMTVPEVIAQTDTDDPALAALFAEIDAFEDAQAKRIYAGFAVIGPMLALEEEGKRPENFLDYWRQLRGLRYAITGDLAGLRAEARARVTAGEENIVLDFPEYKKFSWE